MTFDRLMCVENAIAICKYPYSLSSETLIQAVCSLDSNIERLSKLIETTEDDVLKLAQFKNYVSVLENILVARDRKARDLLAIREPYPAR